MTQYRLSVQVIVFLFKALNLSQNKREEVLESQLVLISPEHTEDLKMLLPSLTSEDLDYLLKQSVNHNDTTAATSLLLDYITPSFEHLEIATKKDSEENLSLLLSHINLNSEEIGTLLEIAYTTSIFVTRVLLSDVRVVVDSSVASNVLYRSKNSVYETRAQYVSYRHISLHQLEEILTEEDDSFESLLLRAILIQGLQGVKLMQWMYLREREKCITVARNILAEEYTSSLIELVFLKLLYPDLLYRELTRSQEVIALLQLLT